ncbi:SDR family NAD(P)-dependent oxidoreductase [Mycolicibacterium sp.]|uniref:SDR family NAD(P)-dependent oxidoreductase n=1 Tax=Mycolicibacterium sp. TaxID=2320850 RepID=UPI003D0D5763
MSTALVTGANGGIGSAIANRLHGHGVRVIGTDVGAAAAPGLADGIHYVAADLAHAEPALDRLLAALPDDGLDYLVHAAGVAMYDRDGSVFDTQDEAVWDVTLGVNLHAVRRLTAAALPHLERGRGKSVVTIASVAGLRGMDAPLDAYQVSKAAVVSLSRAMALKLAADGIRCNAICPGAILTPMIAPLYERSPQRRADMERRTPLGRLGMPDDVAAATCYLLSGDASFITAAELVVDGGWAAQLK